MKDLGKRLRQAREEAGFKTAVAGAQHARLPQQSLSDYEAERRTPGAVAIAQLCRRFGVSADWLLGLPQARP
jgi:transcriptional regulator with XRE-family HTH domain